MKKILIVDDREDNRKVLIKMLLLLGGYQLIEATDGKEAIIQFQQQQPDLILMDINMPIMNGYDSTTAIKALAEDYYIPIIFVTALGSDDHLKQALAAGGDDFITKPVNFSILESKINAHLRIRELNQQLILHNQHLSYEQELIEHIFENALKQSYLDPKVIRYHMTAMSVFAGDILLVARGPEGGLYLLMGDFTGHGLTAAMGTLPVAMIFFKMTAQGNTVSEITKEINRQLNQLMPVGIFFAASLIKLSPEGNNVTVWMGGLPESFWLGADGDLKGLIASKHLALGILPDSSFDSSTDCFDVEYGDKVYLYSDGVTESLNTAGEMFGEQRFKELLLQYKDDRFGHIIDALHEFSGQSEQSDDITLVELTCSAIAAKNT